MCKEQMAFAKAHQLPVVFFTKDADKRTLELLTDPDVVDMDSRVLIRCATRGWSCRSRPRYTRRGCLCRWVRQALCVPHALYLCRSGFGCTVAPLVLGWSGLCRCRRGCACARGAVQVPVVLV